MFFGSYLINHVFEQNVSHGEISYLNAKSPGPLKMAKNVAKMANVDKSVAVVESKMFFFSMPFFCCHCCICDLIMQNEALWPSEMRLC